MPVILAAHGAPILLDDPVWMAELATWAERMPRPRSILMISAHWEEQPTTLGATRTVPLIHDFFGFPPKYYRTEYPAPGAPELARRVLIFGSGFLTHNMRYAFRPGIPDWARAFDQWVAEALTRFDVEALVDFRSRAPAVDEALPTWEHYAPVLIAAGAAAGDAGSASRPRVTFPITEFWIDGAFSKRSVQFD
jgi:aromatic ring-opening dioxygenase catalytic subunit (LigB family)